VIGTAQRTHRADATDRITLTIASDFTVKQGDTLTVDVVVEPDPNNKRLIYQIIPEGSRLTVERMPIF